MQKTTYTNRDGELRKITEIFELPADDTRESVLRRRYEYAVKKVFGEGGNLLEIRQRKIGRNDPCPCGSGRKFKRCCESRLNLAINTGE